MSSGLFKSHFLFLNMLCRNLVCILCLWCNLELIIILLFQSLQSTPFVIKTSIDVLMMLVFFCLQLYYIPVFHVLQYCCSYMLVLFICCCFVFTLILKYLFVVTQNLFFLLFFCKNNIMHIFLIEDNFMVEISIYLKYLHWWILYSSL